MRLQLHGRGEDDEAGGLAVRVFAHEVFRAEVVRQGLVVCVV